MNAVYYNSWSRTLWVHGVAVREFHRDADNQAPVLEALQDAGWPPKLYSVFRGNLLLEPKHRLSDTIRELNKHQTPKKAIRFSVERGTQAVLWRLKAP